MEKKKKKNFKIDVTFFLYWKKKTKTYKTIYKIYNSFYLYNLFRPSKATSPDQMFLLMESYSGEDNRNTNKHQFKY